MILRRNPIAIDQEARSLAQKLRAAMLPLLVLLVSTLATSAPTAILVLGFEELHQHAEYTARKLSALIESEEPRALLWKYNTPKLVEHLRTFRSQESIDRIEVEDGTGRLIPTADVARSARPASRAGGVWGFSPVSIQGENVGFIWVSMRTDALVTEAVWMFGVFFLIGLGLSGLLYWLPQRSMGKVGGRIASLVEELRRAEQALEGLNQDLEQKVRLRSAELEDALQTLTSRDQMLRELSSQAIILQENERRAISRELHDAVGQALTAIRIQMQLLVEQSAGSSPGDARATALSCSCQKTIELVDEALEDVRRAVAMLSPRILDEIGLIQAIHRHCTDFCERTGIAVEAELAELPGDLSPALESTCYRLVQEGLTNAARHASASQVRISLGIRGDRLSLVVRDNGVGMDADPQGEARKKGHGLRGMLERVTLLDGQMEVTSKPGEGTTLSVELPIC